MKLHQIILMSAALVITSCSTSTRETPNGFKFNVYKEGDGIKATSGQLIAFNLKIHDSKDSTWVDTYEMGKPEFFPVGDSTQMAEEDGFSQMMRMLTTGDSAGFSITIKKLYSDWVKQPIPPTFDSTLTFTYTVSVDKVLSKETYPQYQGKINEKFAAKQEAKAVIQLAKDTVTIKEFLASNNITAEKLPSGIYYNIIRKGEGPTAESGQKVSVNYTGYLLDGVYFDTSEESVAKEKGIYNPMRAAQMPYQPFEVVIDQSSVIQGWHEALKQLNAGSKGTFYIPSTLGYGPYGSGPKIKPNAVLVFDIELIQIN